MVVEDFANIPRYLQAVTAKPETFLNQIKSQYYQFKMKDGSYIYGQADLPKMRDKGFWIEPYFSQDELPGKLYLFSDKVQEAQPVITH